MDFNKTIATLERWIKSCVHREQLNLCRDAIDRFLIDRFKNHVDSKTYNLEISRLHILIMDMERVLDYK